MTAGIVAPIVVADGLDVTFHRAPGDVGGYYESWFPDSVEYRAFDAEGRRLELRSEGSSLLVRTLEDAPSGDDELCELLRAVLRGRRPSDTLLDELSLPQLLDLAVARIGFLP